MLLNLKMDADADECVFNWVAQNTIGVAVGMSLRVKNQSDQNLIRYLIRKWVCWLLMNEHFSDYSNLFFFMYYESEYDPVCERNGPLACVTQYEELKQSKFDKIYLIKIRYVYSYWIILFSNQGSIFVPQATIWCPHWGILRWRALHTSPVSI